MDRRRQENLLQIYNLGDSLEISEIYSRT